MLSEKFHVREQKIEEWREDAPIWRRMGKEDMTFLHRRRRRRSEGIVAIIPTYNPNPQSRRGPVPCSNVPQTEFMWQNDPQKIYLGLPAPRSSVYSVVARRTATPRTERLRGRGGTGRRFAMRGRVRPADQQWRLGYAIRC